LARLRRLARERGEIAAPDLFVELGELTADGGLARAESGGKVGERCCDARAGLEQDEGCRNALEFGDARAPCCLLCWQETLEEKTVGREPAQRERCEHRRRSWQRGHACARGARFAHQLVAGVGYERCAGVRDQRDRSAGAEPSDELRSRLRGIVLMVSGERGRDAIVVEKLAGDASVFAGDQLGGGKYLERPHGDVTQIADRGGDQIEPGWQRRCGGGTAVENIVPGGAERGWALGCGRPPHPPYCSGATLPRHRRLKAALSFSFG